MIYVGLFSILFLEREKFYGENDASNFLNSKKMKAVTDELHPRIKVEDKETGEVTYRKMSVCKSNMGWHDCCSRNRRKSDFDEFGIGTVLYFQMLKYLGCMFLLMFLLSIPAICFFSYGTELTEGSFTKIVTAASLGNLGTSKPVCKTGSYDLATGANPKAAIFLDCPFGDLYAISEFGQLSREVEVDC